MESKDTKAEPKSDAPQQAARYILRAPSYVRINGVGTYVADTATAGNPVVVELPTTVTPSLTWDAANAAALAALQTALTEVISAATAGVTDKAKADAIAHALRTRHAKTLKKEPVAAPPVSTATTNAELAGRRPNVVGRPSDGSPV